MSSLIFLAIKTAICALLCQFCDCCDNSDECPDGVCDPLRDALSELEATTPALEAKPSGKLMAWSINWDAVQDAIPVIAEAVRAIARIFTSQKVGG
jgi:hypothetical protein